MSNALHSNEQIRRGLRNSSGSPDWIDGWAPHDAHADGLPYSPPAVGERLRLPLNRLLGFTDSPASIRSRLHALIGNGQDYAACEVTVCSSRRALTVDGRQLDVIFDLDAVQVHCEELSQEPIDLDAASFDLHQVDTPLLRRTAPQS